MHEKNGRLFRSHLLQICFGDIVYIYYIYSFLIKFCNIPSLIIKLTELLILSDWLDQSN